ncbi:hypothetical protein NG895_16505 [Aeoliella sp. ICT_H6.2]|uniref:Uncharacterized protein n=1 Tax=Aeoliella straminimaris TaxID=2954799 RepID=A0A9X2FFS9_9BACT|nr:hypothetical protein [Aeoliella straminimaris]MCO6045514.1 hypothetical protein [Aeoliella straminimaris]
MKLGPSLIGAIVGGLVAVAAQIGLESSLGKEAIWFALVSGLLTGFGARMMAGDGIRHGSFVRAALVAFVALAAIFGGSYISAEMTRKKASEAYESKPTTSPVDQQTEEEGAAATVEADEPAGDEDSTEPAPGEEETSTAEEAETEDADTEEPAEEPAERGEADDAASDEAETVAEVEETEVEVTEPQDPQTLDAIAKYKAKGIPNQKLDIWQLVFVVLGTLLAYELARGGGKAEQKA